MCECGCSIGFPVRELPGPGDTVWLLQFSHGCRDCSIPVGVLVTRAKRGDVYHQGSGGAMPQIEYPERSEWPVRFIDLDVVEERISKSISAGFGVAGESQWPEGFYLDVSELAEELHELIAKELRGSLREKRGAGREREG